MLSPQQDGQEVPRTAVVTRARVVRLQINQRSSGVGFRWRARLTSSLRARTCAKAAEERACMKEVVSHARTRHAGGESTKKMGPPQHYGIAVPAAVQERKKKGWTRPSRSPLQTRATRTTAASRPSTASSPCLSSFCRAFHFFLSFSLSLSAPFDRPADHRQTRWRQCGRGPFCLALHKRPSRTSPFP